MMDEEFINFKSLEKKTKSVIMTCVKEGNNACEATSEVMDLWFPGVVKASDGGTMYNDIDLEVQYILTRNGYPEDDDE